MKRFMLNNLYSRTPLNERFTDYPLEMESVEDDDDALDFDFGDTYLDMEFED